MEALRSYLLGLTAAAVFCAAATELTPKGPVKGVVRTLCAVVMTAALLSPLAGLDLSGFSLQTARYRDAAAAVTAAAEETAEELNRAVIEERLEAYILDKAPTLGAKAAGARVTLRWSAAEGVWYPSAVTVDGGYHAALSAWLEGELGIPAAAQTWRDGNGDGPETAGKEPGEK